MNNPIRSHLIILGITGILLGLIIYKPFGIINDKMIYGNDVLFAYQEGVASCSSSFSFKKNGIYIQEAFCFGLKRNVGNYTIKNDTIVMDTTKINHYKYGVINRKDSILEMYFLQPKTTKDFNQFKYKEKLSNREKQHLKYIRWMTYNNKRIILVLIVILILIAGFICYGLYLMSIEDRYGDLTLVNNLEILTI